MTLFALDNALVPDDAGADRCLCALPCMPDTEKVLYAFQGGSDGGQPYDRLLGDKAGNLYGTTAVGTVFKLASDGTKVVLRTFNYHDGWDPQAGVIMDSVGNLYGTAAYGGTVEGTAFELAPDGTLTALHNFTDIPDGANPFGGLVTDKAGNLYGTTWAEEIAVSSEAPAASFSRSRRTARKQCYTASTGKRRMDLARVTV